MCKEYKREHLIQVIFIKLERRTKCKHTKELTDGYWGICTDEIG